MYEELRLGNELTTRTKNNLIFRNEATALAKEDLLQRLNELQIALQQEKDNLEMKEVLMNMIQL